MLTFLRSTWVASLVILVGCATPGTRPPDMTVAGHEEAAARAEGEAAKEAHTLPSGSVAAGRCANAPCWTGGGQQTDDAKHLMAVAAKHRAAAQALRDAEARACAGISDPDRDISPFAHREDIAGVSRWEERETKSAPRLRGAAVEFRAVPGLTAEWLQRAMNCHLARVAALGYDQPEMASCPLAIKGVSAHVHSGGDRLVVEIGADGREAAAEVWKRAQSLAGSRAPAP